MAHKTRQSRPDDPDKDPWTGTQVAKAYGVHTERAAKKGVKPASRERWMAVKGLVEAEVVTDIRGNDRQLDNGVGVPPPPRAGPGGLTKGPIPFCSGNSVKLRPGRQHH